MVKLEVFVASPGDVPTERRAVEAVVDEIRATICPVLGIDIHAFFWERDLGPGVDRGGPQGLVDKDSNLEFCDVLVGVFWNRLGTPTPDGKTGTEHEVTFCYNRWQKSRKPQKPHIMLYFSDQPITQTAENLAQSNSLLKFRSGLPPDVFTWNYASAPDFEKIFRKHFTKHVMQAWNDLGRPTGSDTDIKVQWLTSPDEVISVNSEIVGQAERVFFATGSRSRDEKYLQAIEQRLQEAPRLVHYRVLMGPPFRNILKQHLLRLLAMRPASDRSQGLRTLYLGIFNDPKRQPEVFIAGNEKRVLIVLPSRKGVGLYDTALVIDDPGYVNDAQSFVTQLWNASDKLETRDELEDLQILIP